MSNLLFGCVARGSFVWCRLRSTLKWPSVNSFPKSGGFLGTREALEISVSFSKMGAAPPQLSVYWMLIGVGCCSTEEEVGDIRCGYFGIAYMTCYHENSFCDGATVLLLTQKKY